MEHPFRKRQIPQSPKKRSHAGLLDDLIPNSFAVLQKREAYNVEVE